MNTEQGLYMLAIMPPGALTKEIEALRFDFSERYHCKAALKPPVHITLIPPFKIEGASMEAIVSQLTEFARLQIPFPLTLKDYGAFMNNGVIYINVVQDDLLELFQKDLAVRMKQLLPDADIKSFGAYRPHITLGYRDIPPELLDAAAFAYRQRRFFATFIVDAFYLWKHDGTHWQIQQTLNMGTMGAYAQAAQ